MPRHCDGKLIAPDSFDFPASTTPQRASLDHSEKFAKRLIRSLRLPLIMKVLSRVLPQMRPVDQGKPTQ